ncbi:hypothetical protein DFR33_110154 [Bradymonas sediminis]|uniref:Uncharacterized protein n=2 Tax=Bradymonas sediminis TaxID=1548548 RepID=A0A2Z4FHZ1_9DELT|nr:hypothetical protein DN745_04425 [Bradymonas sediminis]TDP63696.1 hypothetical protein DFR33_110154 [Bradymonas sediminis]
MKVWPPNRARVYKRDAPAYYLRSDFGQTMLYPALLFAWSNTIMSKSTNHDAEDSREAHASDSYLQSLGEQVEQGLALGSITYERLDFFRALRLLQAGDIEGATHGFRRASRTSDAPFQALSMLSRAECERVLGREATAIRDWTRVAKSDPAPPALRSMAWMSIAALAERREDAKLAAQADAGLKELTQLASANEHLSNPD